MRIVCLNANYDSDVVGGGQRSLQFLTEGLVARGHDVRVISVGPSYRSDVVGGVEHVRVRHRNLYWGFDGRERPALARAAWHTVDAWNPRVANAIEPHVVGFEPDVVHTNVMAGISPTVWSRAKREGLPIVHTLRDWYVVCARSEMYRNGHTCAATCWDCRLFTMATRWQSHRVDAVVGNSQYILERHLDLGAFRDTPVRRVVYNGVDVESDPRRSDRPRGGDVRLGYLGRLDATKGIEWLLDAFARLPRDRVTLDVAGSGEATYESALRSRYASERVRFHGYVEPRNLFARIDLLVVPSLWPEPLPRTAFEAYAHGVPVLGSNRGGIPETIEPDVTGWVFDPTDEASFQRPLERLLADPGLLDRLRRGAFEASERFRPERVVTEYEAVYRDAIEAVRRREEPDGGAQ